MNPVSWKDWIKLPVRSWDLSINSPNMTIRVPTVLVAMSFNKMPVKMFNNRPTKESIWIRDRGVCQYSGKNLKKSEGNIDHVIPKSKGGTDTWDNMVLSSRDLNLKKGNKLNEEVGIKLIKQPKAPRPVYAYEMVKEVKHPDWKPFIVN
jgi:5-methylcytosine-specific restriction endonuclease McrA